MTLASLIAKRMLGTKKPEARRPLYAKVPAEKLARLPKPLPLVSVGYVVPPAPKGLEQPRPVLRTSWSGPCKAISLRTGRQCGLLHGHEGQHRHGSTAFTLLAITNEDVKQARSRLDTAAHSRSSNPMFNF